MSTPVCYSDDFVCMCMCHGVDELCACDKKSLNKVVKKKKTETMGATHHEAVEANKKRFEAYSKKYDDQPSTKMMSDYFALNILLLDPSTSPTPVPVIEEPDVERMKEARISINPSTLKPDSTVIDFACGTGLVAERIIPHLGEGGRLIGIDVTRGMLDQFEEKAVVLRKAYPDVSIDILCRDVLTSDNRDLEGKADLLYCTMAFHHFDDYSAMCHVLKSFLKPKGWIIVFDIYLEEEERATEQDEKTLGRIHNGLSVTGLDLALADGCVNVKSRHLSTMKCWMPEQFVVSHKHSKTDMENVERRDGFWLVELPIIMGVAQRA
eukprot:Blabericola_migrator_1__5614@NODE_2855_length_2281_cov_166_275519_g1791_i0_p1_GENE_NODE_2855_length_2281_cov_166_275519_g1791_i0NODE_2855_length_2281_cov_166_275519_g1791_i0_p1_ORF_typecomplete_len323_score46_46Methyltransf_31/PF13847_6/4_8e18Ubie_methyltran/PF01209_18/6e16Methyltransf_23/PF13489_6/4_5e15Methyltransf_25/PF13649_6/1_1e11Methyltransf_11/PF08241_12/3_4e11Methyltransf_12/PF08242_12/3_3e03Methyltransf_12/PF08242_12/2_2e09CMAS/PF02353_20/3_4e03CMAS/PF02353_20/4_1e07MTS/PF05175_14/1_7e